MRIVVTTLALGWLAAQAAIAGEACKAPAACTEVQTCGSANQCGRCGCASNCEKHCKVVCEMKEVKKTVWVVKCTEFCTTLPNCGHDGCGCCEGCKAGCETETSCCEKCNGKCDPCAAEKNKRIVPPKCGKVREKKTLEKKEVVCKVPVYKCVVVYTCSDCGCQESGDAAPAAAPVPPAKPVAPVPAPKAADSELRVPALAGLSFPEQH